MNKNVSAKSKRKTKPKLTAAERHKRFVAMAHEVEVDERLEAFERAFSTVTAPQKAARRGGS